MKARLLLGIAALAVPALFATPAQADGCSNYQRRARTADLAELLTLRSLARGDACSTEVRNYIQNQIEARGGDAGQQVVQAPERPGSVQALLSRPEEVATPQPQPETRRPPPETATPSVQTATTAQREPEVQAPPPPPVEATPVVEEAPPRPLEALVISQPLAGATLTNADETFGSLYYDQYTLQLEANQFVELVVQAQDFAPIVAIGQGRAPDNFYDMADAFAENAEQVVRLRFRTPEAGEYTVLAASVEQYGTYSISVSPFEPPPPPPPTAIALDSAVTGSFNSDSPVLYEENGVSYALYSFRGRAGEALQLSMTTPDGSGIDPYLVIGRQGENGFEEVDHNDDRGDGTLNSLVRFTPDQDGNYLIRARTFGAEQYGDFQVSAYRVATLTAPQELSRRAGAWVRQGEITVESPVLAGTEETALPVRYVSYEFSPRAGHSYRVRAYAGDFEPIVDVVRAGRGETTPVDVYQKGASTREPNELTFEGGRGSYIVRVSAQSDQAGAFDLVIAEVE